ncbi:hypothetical protein E2320_000735 [Naja naja]|nr:hypothetical protein E2320_000735 [Naja naja]
MSCVSFPRVAHDSSVSLVVHFISPRVPVGLSNPTSLGPSHCGGFFVFVFVWLLLLFFVCGLAVPIPTLARLPGKLGRSESLRVYERKRSQRGSAKGKQPRSRSDVDIEAAPANELEEKPTLEQARQKQGSRNLEPGGAGGGEPPPSFLLSQSEGVEPCVSELELDPPNWRELVPSDTLLRLKKSEHAHLRMLRVLLEVFYQPLFTEGFFTEDELVNIFPSLEDLIEEHKVFLEEMKKLREENNLIVSEIGKTLLTRFDGAEGSWFQKISSRFCSRQSFALEQLKAKQKKETRFNQFIQEAEERQKVEKAAKCCRQILNHVNQEVRVMENLLSTDPLLSEFRNTDISKHNLVYEGPLTWRVTKDKSVDVHVLLLDDILVLLQKQEERLVLKCHSRTITPTPDGKQMLSPIIKLNSAMTREVATDNKAFYVIFSWENGAQIYELVAQTVWCNIISETAGSLKLPASNAKPRLSGGAENGGPFKEALQSEEQEKDGMLEGGEFEERNPVGGAKMDKAVETFMTDLQTFCRSPPPGQASLASAAQDRAGSLNGPPDPEWSSEHLDKESPRFSIVLSLQQSDGVKHHLKLLEDAIQGLKDIETEYWRLQQLMGKLTSSQQSGLLEANEGTDCVG